MEVRSFRRAWLPAILIPVICLVWATAGVAAPASGPSEVSIGAAAFSPSSQADAVTEPATIPGYWQQQRLGTPDRHLTFIDADRGWGASSAFPAAVYRTADGGATWQLTALGDDYDTRAVNDIFFINAQEGWATGRRDYYDLFLHSIFIAHTTDGGATWQDQISVMQSDEAWASGERIWFVTTQQGWVQAGGYLWRTTNGGAAWTRFEPAVMPTRLIRFINGTTGFGMMESWDGASKSLMRTTDAGASWSDLGPLPGWTNAVWVGSGGTNAWAVGENGKIARSSNSGASWTPVSSPTTSRLVFLEFTNSQFGWSAGDAGAVLRTTDGGLTWTRLDPGTGANVTSLSASETANAWIHAGDLRRTRDGGARWSALRTLASDALLAVTMPSLTNGWAGGKYGSILVTADGGRRWPGQVPVAGAINTLDSVDIAHVWALSSGSLQRTIDGGANWATYTAPGGATDMDFVDATRGWLVAGSSIYRTTNGGQNWTEQYASTDYTQLKAIAFADAQRGWVIAIKPGFPAEHITLRTTNGGQTWSPAAGLGYGSYYAGATELSFVSPTQGFGIDGASIQEGSGAIARTTDGGTSWQGLANTDVYTAIDFLNSQEGWVTGTFGRIYRTTNGGATWQTHQLPSRTTLRGVHATAAGQAWFVGEGGLILQYSATEPLGCWATPTPAPPYNGVPPATGTIQRRVSHCMDDTYVRVDTEEQLYDREYVRMGARDGGAITYADGFLFRDVRIPKGAHINSARLRLTAEGHQSGVPVVAVLVGEAQGQSGDFNPDNWWAHLRLRTNARVPWTINATAAGMVESPDISAVVQEIVALNDWRAGNNLSILIDAGQGGQQFVNWWSYDGKPSVAAELVVSYQAGDTPTATPSPTPTQSSGAKARVYLPVILGK